METTITSLLISKKIPTSGNYYSYQMSRKDIDALFNIDSKKINKVWNKIPKENKVDIKK